MKKLFICAALALSIPLAGCAFDTAVVSSASGKGIVAANNLYTAGSKSGQALVELGLLDKERFKVLDNVAYQTLLEVRAGRASLAQLQVAVNAITAR